MIIDTHTRFKSRGGLFFALAAILRGAIDEVSMKSAGGAAGTRGEIKKHHAPALFTYGET